MCSRELFAKRKAYLFWELVINLFCDGRSNICHSTAPRTVGRPDEPFRLRMSIARFRGGERSVHLAMKKCSTVLLVTDITKSIAKLAIYARTSPDQQPGNDETNL